MNDTIHELLTDEVDSTDARKTSLPAELVSGEIEGMAAELGSWLTQARENEMQMLAIWDGQSDDGRKWARNYGRDVFPFDGAADTRVRLVDSAVDELAVLEMTAFSSANLRVMAMEARDVDAAGRVQTLLNYEVKQRMAADLWRELNFLSQWKRMFGHAVMFTGWKREWSTGKEKLTEADLAQMLAERGLMEEQAMTGGEVPEETQVAIAEMSALEVVEMLTGSGRAAEVEALVSQRFPTLSPKRVRQVVKDLRAEGVAEFRVPVEKPGRPDVRALAPGLDVIYPPWVDDVGNAPWVAMVVRLSEPELRAKVNEGWSREFVEAMLKKGPAVVLEAGALMKNLSAQVLRVPQRGMRAAMQNRLNGVQNKECYELFHVYVRVVDEDGVPGIQELGMRPDMKGEDGQPILAFDRLADDWHGKGAFVDFRREYKARSLWDSRGEPELALTPQQEVKALRDSRIDRTALNTLPPMRVNPKRLPGGNNTWDIKPGCKIPNMTGDTTEFLTLPAMGNESLEVEASVRRDLANLLGLQHSELPPEKLMLQRQWIVTGFLTQMREVLLRILALDQQYMSPLQVSRVVGAGPMPYQVTREEIAGQYDLVLHFDVRTLDAAYVTERWNAINEAFKTDRSGALNDVALTRWKLASIDPTLADIAMVDMQAKSRQEADEERAALAQLMLGFEPVPPDGANARVRLETLQTELMQNPQARTLYAQAEDFRERVNRRMAKWEFDLTQMDNAQIGASGWDPARKEPTAADMMMGEMGG